ncbi:MAG: MarR family transcriptional regulator [Novosphingobium sp.]|nr:MarR family transcriptional regulator [Novosphingobium sp.]
MPIALSIFADRSHLRSQISEDAHAAGLRVTTVASLEELLDGAARPLGDVVLLDCPQADGAALAALSRLDMRAAQSGARLIVSTTLEALDDVFSCMDQSEPHLLVDPTRADRVIALGQLLSCFPAARLRELGEEDRLMLLRLAEQVGQIAERIDRLSPKGAPASSPQNESAFRFESPQREFRTSESGDSERLVRSGRPPLPDPRLVRRVIRQRQLRARFFDGDLFADPAWDMLLDLTAARAEHTRVSVTSLCIASGVPPTTALRWISQMNDAGLFERVEDDTDRRRAFIVLTDRAAEAMARYFAELGGGAAQLL